MSGLGTPLDQSNGQGTNSSSPNDWAYTMYDITDQQQTGHTSTRPTGQPPTSNQQQQHWFQQQKQSSSLSQQPQMQFTQTGQQQPHYSTSVTQQQQQYMPSVSQQPGNYSVPTTQQKQSPSLSQQPQVQFAHTGQQQPQYSTSVTQQQQKQQKYMPSVSQQQGKYSVPTTQQKQQQYRLPVSQQQVNQQNYSVPTIQQQNHQQYRPSASVSEQQGDNQNCRVRKAQHQQNKHTYWETLTEQQKKEYKAWVIHQHHLKRQKQQNVQLPQYESLSRVPAPRSEEFRIQRAWQNALKAQKSGSNMVTNQMPPYYNYPAINPQTGYLPNSGSVGGQAVSMDTPFYQRQNQGYSNVSQQFLNAPTSLPSGYAVPQPQVRGDRSLPREQQCYPALQDNFASQDGNPQSPTLTYPYSQHTSQSHTERVQMPQTVNSQHIPDMPTLDPNHQDILSRFAIAQVRKRKRSGTDQELCEDTLRIKSVFSVPSCNEETDDRAVYRRWYTQPSPEQVPVQTCQQEEVCSQPQTCIAQADTNLNSDSMERVSDQGISTVTHRPMSTNVESAPETINKEPVFEHKVFDLLKSKPAEETPVNLSRGELPTEPENREVAAVTTTISSDNTTCTSNVGDRGTLGADTRTETGASQSGHSGDISSSRETNIPEYMFFEDGGLGQAPVNSTKQRGRGRGRGRGRSRGRRGRGGSRGRSETGCRQDSERQSLKGKGPLNTVQHGKTTRGRGRMTRGKRGTGRGRGKGKSPSLDSLIMQESDVEALAEYLNSYSEAALTKKSISLKSLHFLINKMKEEKLKTCENENVLKKTTEIEKQEREENIGITETVDVEKQECKKDNVSKKTAEVEKKETHSINKKKKQLGKRSKKQSAGADMEVAEMEAHDKVPIVENIDNNSGCHIGMLKETNENNECEAFESITAKNVQTQNKGLIVKLRKVYPKNKHGKEKRTLMCPKDVNNAENVNTESGVINNAENVNAESGVINNVENVNAESGVINNAENVNAESGVINNAENVNAESGAFNNAESGVINNVEDVNAESGAIDAESGAIDAESGAIDAETANAESGAIDAESGEINDAETANAESGEINAAETANAESGAIEKTYVFDENHRVRFVTFHGKMVVMLETKEGRYFLMKELLKRLFCKGVKEKGALITATHQTLIIKEKQLNIPFKPMDGVFYPLVDKYLKQRNICRKLPSKVSIISDHDANRLFHCIFGRRYCNNNSECIVNITAQNLASDRGEATRRMTTKATYSKREIKASTSNASKESTNKENKATSSKSSKETSLTDNPDEEILINASKATTCDALASEPMCVQNDTPAINSQVLDSESIPVNTCLKEVGKNFILTKKGKKGNSESGKLKKSANIKDRNIFQWIQKETLTDSRENAISEGNEGETGYESDATLPYEDKDDPPTEYVNEKTIIEDDIDDIDSKADLSTFEVYKENEFVGVLDINSQEKLNEKMDCSTNSELKQLKRETCDPISTADLPETIVDLTLDGISIDLTNECASDTETETSIVNVANLNFSDKTGKKNIEKDNSCIDTVSQSSIILQGIVNKVVDNLNENTNDVEKMPKETNKVPDPLMNNIECVNEKVLRSAVTDENANSDMTGGQQMIDVNPQSAGETDATNIKVAYLMDNFIEDDDVIEIDLGSDYLTDQTNEIANTIITDQVLCDPSTLQCALFTNENADPVIASTKSNMSCPESVNEASVTCEKPRTEKNELLSATAIIKDNAMNEDLEDNGIASVSEDNVMCEESSNEGDSALENHGLCNEDSGDIRSTLKPSYLCDRGSDEDDLVVTQPNELVFLDDTVIIQNDDFINNIEKKLQSFIDEVNISRADKHVKRMPSIYRELDEISKPVFDLSIRMMRRYKQSSECADDNFLLRDLEEIETSYKEVENTCTDFGSQM